MFTAAKIRTFRIYYPHTPYFLGFIHKKGSHHHYDDASPDVITTCYQIFIACVSASQKSLTSFFLSSS